MIKPRVLVFAHSTGATGAERSLLETLKLLQNQFSFLVIIPGDGPFLEALKTETEIPYRRLRSYFFYEQPHARKIHALRRRLVNIWALRRAHTIAASWAPDLIYTNTIASWIGPRIAQRLSCPHVWHLRELSVESAVGDPVAGRAAEHALLTWPGHRFLSNSKFVADWYAENFGCKAQPTYQPISVPSDIQAPQKDKKGPVKLISLGRLSRQKGHHITLRALSLLDPSLRDKLTFDIYGTGTKAEKTKLQEQIVSAQLDAQVSLKGFTQEGPEKIAQSDAVIVAADDEAFGRVTAEAMRIGCPVIGMATSGTLELIGADASRGTLFENNHAPDLARAITQFIQDPAPARAKAKTAQLWAKQNLSAQHYRDQLTQAFLGAIAARK